MSGLGELDAGAVLQFETGSGTLGTCHTGYYLSDRGKDTHFGLYGTDAQAQTPLHHDSLQHEPTIPPGDHLGRPRLVGRAQADRPVRLYLRPVPAWGDFVYDHFEGYETGDVPAAVDDTVQLLRVMDAAWDSADRDEWVSVDD